MNIPSYEDIYEFPGGYRRDCYQHHHNMFQPSYVHETSKDVQIVDSFGRLRYIVQLSSEQFDDARGYKTIVTQALSNDLSTFLEIPEDHFEFDYREAIQAFNVCVKKYQSLVNAEMKDFRDIEVYKEEIGYEVQDPRCCKNCKWCMHNLMHQHCYNNFKLQCCNPLNQQVFNYAQQYPQFPSKPDGCNMPLSWQKLPWQKPEDISSFIDQSWDINKMPNVAFPVVNPLGICKNYISC